MLEDQQFLTPPSSPPSQTGGLSMVEAPSSSKQTNSKLSSVTWCTDYFEVISCEKPHNFKVGGLTRLSGNYLIEGNNQGVVWSSLRSIACHLFNKIPTCCVVPRVRWNFKIRELKMTFIFIYWIYVAINYSILSYTPSKDPIGVIIVPTFSGVS